MDKRRIPPRSESLGAIAISLARASPFGTDNRRDVLRYEVHLPFHGDGAFDGLYDGVPNPLCSVLAQCLGLKLRSALKPFWPRLHFFGLRPTSWVLLSSLADICMAPLPLGVIVCEFAAALGFGLILVGVKVPVFKRLGIF